MKSAPGFAPIPILIILALLVIGGAVVLKDFVSKTPDPVPVVINSQPSSTPNPTPTLTSSAKKITPTVTKSPTPTNKPGPTSTPAPSNNNNNNTPNTPTPTSIPGTFVSMTSPNGGESFTQGQIISITWDTNILGTCSLQTIDSNNSGIQIRDNYLASNKQLNWTVNMGNTALSQREFKVRIACYDANNNQTNYVDTSDNYFTISQ